MHPYLTSQELPKTSLKSAVNEEQNKGILYSDMADGVGTWPSQVGTFLQGLIWLLAPTKAESSPIMVAVEVETEGSVGPTAQLDCTNWQVPNSLKDYVPKSKVGSKRGRHSS